MQIAKATNILATAEGATDSPQKPHVKLATYDRTRRSHLVVARGEHVPVCAKGYLLSHARTPIWLNILLGQYFIPLGGEAHVFHLEIEHCEVVNCDKNENADHRIKDTVKCVPEI